MNDAERCLPSEALFMEAGGSRVGRGEEDGGEEVGGEGGGGTPPA